VIAMRLTAFTDYSLRVLIYVALNSERNVTIREVADVYGISKNHLMKVVRELSQNGLLVAARGKNGGLRLGAAPQDINIGNVVRQMEADLQLAECFHQDGHCAITPACSLKAMFAEALEAFFSVLDDYTLADMVQGKQRRALVQLLHLE
jgi:Rrf2 family nitric oxide-sensitive transcriptional repressor